MLATVTVRDLSVREHMTANPVVFKPELEVYAAIRDLLTHKVTGAPVLDRKGRLVGLFSELDCMKVAVSAAYHEDMPGTVAEFMTTNFKTVDGDLSIVEAAEMFTESPQRHFPVLDEGHLVGVISRVDILKALLSLW
ncbi:CBS domain-containing protein [Candidatus Methylocalor cossyra]|uniref:CBS domain-containing protein n=1 Tax=Candidatus Methylocalor cossyra TaxID=3108543 RepID=A0ABM9NLW1_9GAMM